MMDGMTPLPLIAVYWKQKKQSLTVYIPAGIFQLDDDRPPLGNVRIQGAGIWYSELHVAGNAFSVSAASFELRDFALFGNTTFRDNMVAESGFRGDAGENSNY